jgi:transposase
MQKIDGRALDHSLSEHLRILAVRRVIEDRERPSAVIRSMGLHRTSIYRWLETYRECGYEGLKGSKASGPTPKLDEKQRQNIRRWIVGKDPRQYGFDFGLWTRSIVRQLIKERFAVELSLATVGAVLARLNLTPQKPLRRAYERDPEAVDEWLKAKYPKLRRRAKRNDAAIFFLDEAGFSSEPNLGRTYGEKGKTPVVTTTGQRQKVNAISAVNAKGEFWCSIYTGKLNAESFVGFLKDFLGTQERKVYLVVDGHPSHRAKKVANFVQATAGRLELHFLPPYAPDLNPDEFVWQYAKTNGVAKKPLRQNESLRERVESDLRRIGTDKQLIRSFFCAPSVSYAADR